MGTSSGRFPDPKRNTMPNRNRPIKENVIDLTQSFTLAGHNHLDSAVINLDTDDSIREENTESPRPRRARKRRHSRTRATINLETTIVDLSTPEGKIKPKKTKKKPDEAVVIDEPEEKRAKQTLGSCPICFDDFCGQALASTKCGHIYCLVCLQRALKNRVDPRCPTCRTPLRGKARYHPIYL